jgi:hypothetical protein
MTWLHERRGVALFAALMIISLIALLIGGAVATSTMAQRSNESSRSDASLMATADYAVYGVLSGPAASSFADLPLGRNTTYSVNLPPSPPITATVSATRLPDDVLWLVADAELLGRDAGRRRVNLVARWRPLLPLPVSPLMARGSVRLRGGLVVAGDTASDAECAATSFASVTVSPGSLVTSADSVSSATDPRAGDPAHYAQTDWQLRALENASGAIHVRADTQISNSSFQGVMIADGSVSIVGPFTLKGIIVARGPIVSSTNALSITGAMLSFAVPSAGQFAIDVAGGVVRFSPCVVARELRRVAQLRVVQQRNWTEIF